MSSSEFKNTMSSPSPAESKPKTPVELVHQTTDHLNYLKNLPVTEHRRIRETKELVGNSIRQLHTIVYGTAGQKPVRKDCTDLTRAFFKTQALRLLIHSLSTLSQETQKHSVQLVTFLLQHSPPGSAVYGAQYLVSNLDLLDTLRLNAYGKKCSVPATTPFFDIYDDLFMDSLNPYQRARIVELETRRFRETLAAENHGTILHRCLRSQLVAIHVLYSIPTMTSFFDYITDSEVTGGVFGTFRQLLTLHKPMVADFLSENYEWFFGEYNVRLLGSTEFRLRKISVQLLGDVLMEPENAAVTRRYVGSIDNLRLVMNLLEEECPRMKVDVFKVFRLFVVAEEKPSSIVDVLVENRDKFVKLIQNLIGLYRYYNDRNARWKLENMKGEVVRCLQNLVN